MDASTSVTGPGRNRVGATSLERYRPLELDEHPMRTRFETSDAALEIAPPRTDDATKRSVGQKVTHQVTIHDLEPNEQGAAGTCTTAPSTVRRKAQIAKASATAAWLERAVDTENVNLDEGWPHSCTPRIPRAVTR